MSSAQVNRPTDVKLKEEDVSRKLQLYGIFTAFQNGKVPSNEQIDIALNSFLKSKALASPSTRLSAEGQGLVADFRTVVEQAKYLLLSKNEGNLLQDFIWQSQQISGGNAALPGAPVDKETARQHGNEALEGLRTLGTLIISNGQFRKLLNDATILIRDIAGDAAEKTASRVKPSSDQLSQIDAPAADNTWHESPDLSPGNLKSQFKNSLSKNTPISKGDIRDAAGDATATADPHGSRDPADVAQKAQYDQTQGTNSGVDGATGVQTGIQSLKDKASNNIDDEDKEKARQKKAEARERAKKYLSQKMPEERREQSIWRLKKMIVEIQGHPDYQQAITTLLNLAEEYAGHANTMGQGGVGTVKGAHQDDALQLAEKDLKTLIERFANGTSTDDLFSSINTIYRDAEKDPELKNWFKQVDTYIRKCLKQQGYIMEDGATDEWNELYDRGNFLLRDRYRNHTDRIFDETKFLADQFDQDPQNKRFAESVQKLFNDLGNDENGKPTFKPHLLKDLSEVIIPATFENVRYVPIPRIEFSDPTIDVVIENLVIESDNLMPNVLEIASDNYFRYGRKKIANKNSNSVMLSISGVQMDLRDVSFFVKRKQGFPSLTDQGVADIYLGGSGLSFKVKLSTADGADKRNFFKCDKVDVDVKNFNIKLKQSKHKLLFAVAKPILLKVLRPALQKALEKVIKDKVHELDTLAYEIKIEADRALAEAKENPDQAQNIYQRYVTAAQKKVMQGKQKTQEVASNTKVNVAVTQQDSIFPQVQLPGGISSEATKYKELAAKGDKWESPIFKIGSASPSTDIPSAIQITRKEHSVNEGGVRGPQNIGNTGSVTDRLRDPSAQAAGQNGNGNYTNGFSNQVDQAFSKDGSHNGTTLGSNNPVYNGSV